MTLQEVHDRILPNSIKGIEVRGSCVPRNKGRQPLRGRGDTAEGDIICLEDMSWSVG